VEPLKAEVIAFYKWLYKTDEKPKVVKWIRCKSFTQIYDERDVDWHKNKFVPLETYHKMINHISNDIQMTAYLEILYFSHFRPSEVLSMNIGDVEICEGYINLTCRESKTKKRTTTVKPILELLVRWIDNHSFKTDKDYPLFHQ
jgi:integrase